MQKTVKVIGVNQDVPKEKRAGGTYQCTLFQYEDEGQPKVQAFATAFLKAVPQLANSIHELVAGDMVAITLEKKGEFWNMTNVTKDLTAAPKPTLVRSNPTFTPDARQDSIVFQNAMAHATAVTIHNNKSKVVDITEIIALAKRIAMVSRAPKLDEVEAIPEAKVKKAVVAPAVTPAVAAPIAQIMDDDVPFGD